MATPIRIQVNQAVQWYVNMTDVKDGKEALGGLVKLVMRGMTGRRTAAEVRQALVLTAAEESQLLSAGKSFLFKWAGRFFLFASITDLVVKFLEGEGTVRTPEDRIGIVVAHLAKGSSPALTAVATVEQVIFGLHDAFFAEKNMLESALDVAEAVLDFLPPVLSGPPAPPDLVYLVPDADLLLPIIQPIPHENQHIVFGPGHRLFRSIDP